MERALRSSVVYVENGSRQTISREQYAALLAASEQHHAAMVEAGVCDADSDDEDYTPVASVNDSASCADIADLMTDMDLSE